MKVLTLKAQEIKANIASKFGSAIQADGFVYRKSDNEFRRRVGDYTYIFNIDQVGWSNSSSLHVRLYITQKQIETIVERILGKQRHSITMGQDIDLIYKSTDGRIVEKGNLSIWLYQDEDIETAVETLSRYYRDIAKPYFARYTSLEAIDDVMNRPPFDYCPADVGGMFYDRCIRGLVVARLVKNPGYDALGLVYDNEIKTTMNGDFIEAYHTVREYLNYNRIA